MHGVEALKVNNKRSTPITQRILNHEGGVSDIPCSCLRGSGDILCRLCRYRSCFPQKIGEIQRLEECESGINTVFSAKTHDAEREMKCSDRSNCFWGDGGWGGGGGCA